MRNTWREIEREHLRFGSPSPPPPPPPPPPLEREASAEAEKAAEEARRQAKRRRGRSQTILTSPTGAPLGESMVGGQPNLGA